VLVVTSCHDHRTMQFQPHEHAQLHASIQDHPHASAELWLPPSLYPITRVRHEQESTYCSGHMPHAQAT